MKKLLALPQRERRRIAEKLFESLSAPRKITPLSLSEEKLIEQRWNDYVSGKMKFYSSEEMKKRVFGK